MGFKLTKKEVAKLLDPKQDHAQKFASLKITKSYVRKELSSSELEIAEDIFRLLCKKADVFVRIILSESLKTCDTLPHDIVIQLAKDVEEVATPMLEYSQVLTNEDLYEIIDEESKAKRVAIAKRKKLPKEVVLKLLDTKEKSVVQTLTINQAILKNPDLHQLLVENLAGDKNQVPATVIEKVVTQTGNALIKAINKKYDISPQNKLEKAKEIGTEITTLLMIGDNSPLKQTEKLVTYLHYNNRLTPSYIVNSICLGKLHFFVCAISKKLRLEPEIAAKIIRDGGDYGLNKLLRKAGVEEKLITGLIIIMKLAYEKRSTEPNISTINFCEWLIRKLENTQQNGNIEHIQIFLTIAKKGGVSNSGCLSA